jgi:aspartyl-tRNA(Asn)/glutamyl-tRNA(Gln) amidotransferase subunit C
MTISREDVLRVAELAHLELGEHEIEKYREQLKSSVESSGKLHELDTANIEPMAQVFAAQSGEEVNSTLREDVVFPCDVAQEIL